jgi:hypothetical protein
MFGRSQEGEKRLLVSARRAALAIQLDRGVAGRLTVRLPLGPRRRLLLRNGHSRPGTAVTRMACTAVPRHRRRRVAQSTAMLEGTFHPCPH